MGVTILGLAFPFQKGTTEFPRQKVDDDVIEDNIRRILLTRRGERVMRPRSGSDTMSFVFESVGSVLRARIANEVRRAIAEGEPRVQIERVQVLDRFDSITKGRQVFVLITYRVQGLVKKTNTRLV